MTLAETAEPVAATARPLPLPAARRLDRHDLLASLAAGWADFRAAPTQLAFLCAIYPIVALLLARAAAGGALLPLLYPAASGFALVGPVAAIGLFEISRRRERGDPVHARDAFGVLREPGFASVAVLGIALLLLFVLWLACAEALFAATLGDADFSGPAAFFAAVFGTGSGWLLIVAGNAAGLVFASVVLATATFSIPMAIDRATPPLASIRTSIGVTRRNPAVVMAWGLIVAVILLAASLPAFTGLAVALPVLGHATWHLYRRAVASGDTRGDAGW